MSNQIILKAKNLSYSIGYKKVLKKLNFEIHSGELVLVTGNNGAGKTTLLKILSNYTQYTDSIYWKITKPVISYLGHELGLYSSLTLMENISYFKNIVPGCISDLEIKELLNLFQLNKRIDEPIIEFSKGMKQKSALIRAFLPSANLYLLDEPFSGLDIHSSQKLLSIIQEKKKSSSIILVTHHKELLSNITDKFFHIDSGELSIV